MGAFMHGEQHLAGEEPGRLSYEHQNNVELDGQLALAENCPPSSIPQKLSSDGDNNGKDIESVAGVTHDCGFPKVVQKTGGILPAVMNVSGIVKVDYDKRHLDDEVYLFSNKRQKQVEQNIASYPVGYCSNPKTMASVEWEPKSTEADASEDIMNETSNFSLTCSNSEEETCFDLPVEENLHNSHYYDDHYQASGYGPEEIYSFNFDYYPRKHVAIGTDHQVDIPELESHIFKDMSNSIDCASALRPITNIASSRPIIDEDDCARFVGSCIMPMPDISSLTLGAGNLHRKTECSCLDEGSARCVRQHIMEARQNFRKILGEDKFEELGFCDMGEDVAQKWTEDEEELFHKVVLSNPASAGKNFWDYLPLAFPTRTSKELISYYFNVFILRKREGQNRLDPLNADSDNDEWQESDDGEFAEEYEEEEEDSVVESPIDQGDVYEMDDQEEIDMTEETKDGDESEEYAAVDGHVHGSFGVSQGFINEKSNFLPDTQLEGENIGCYPDDHDFQDDSCTSYEGQKHGRDSHGCPLDILDSHHSLIGGHQYSEYRNDGLSGVTDHGFFETHCDSKAWDVSYSFGSEKDDFLSTFNVIEEVLGEESRKEM